MTCYHFVNPFPQIDSQRNEVERSNSWTWSNSDIQMSLPPIYIPFLAHLASTSVVAEWLIKFLIFSLRLLIAYFFMIQHGIVTTTMITMKKVLKSYRHRLQAGKSCDMNFEMGVAVYARIKEMWKDINELFTFTLFLFYTASITYFAGVPKVYMTSSATMLEKLLMLRYIVFTIFIWTLCSQIHHEVNYFKLILSLLSD